MQAMVIASSSMVGCSLRVWRAVSGLEFPLPDPHPFRKNVSCAILARKISGPPGLFALIAASGGNRGRMNSTLTATAQSSASGAAVSRWE